MGDKLSTLKSLIVDNSKVLDKAFQERIMDYFNWQTDNTGIDSSGNIIISPNYDKYIYPIIDQADYGGDVRIALVEDANERVNDTTIVLPIISDGNNLITLSPELELHQVGSINTASRTLHLIFITYKRENFKTVQIQQYNPPDETAPTATSSPTDGATGVSTSNNITVTWNEAVRKTNLVELDNANVADVMTLKETDANGADVAFTPTISADKKTMTFNPDAALTSAQTYYCEIAIVEDYSGNERNSVLSFSFTTA